MIRWIFWILIAIWLLSKLKYLFADNMPENNNENTDFKQNDKRKQLKNDAGDYADYEELN